MADPDVVLLPDVERITYADGALEVEVAGQVMHMPKVRNVSISAEPQWGTNPGDPVTSPHIVHPHLERIIYTLTFEAIPAEQGKSVAIGELARIRKVGHGDGPSMTKPVAVEDLKFRG